jgi:hypothetical protein
MLNTMKYSVVCKVYKTVGNIIQTDFNTSTVYFYYFLQEFDNFKPVGVKELQNIRGISEPTFTSNEVVKRCRGLGKRRAEI